MSSDEDDFGGKEEVEKVGGYARRYRPSSLAGYIGNESLRNTVMSVMRGKVMPQTFLLTGTTGCGKTTLARIIGKEYTCQKRDGETGACDECEDCVNMNEFVATGQTDRLEALQEIDITSEGGKADIERVLEEMAIPFMDGTWKVFIFDEVHMATTAAQNRMLKIIEEPPPETLIIFCTTDPEKMLPTLRNRCQMKMMVKRPRIHELSALMQSICAAESVQWDKEGMRLIATKAGFVIRDSLNLLEQVVSVWGNARGKSVAEQFDEVQDDLIFRFYRYLQEDQKIEYMVLLNDVKMKMDLGLFVDALKLFTNRGIYILNGVDVEGMSKAELQTYAQLFSKFDVGEIAVLLRRLGQIDTGNVESNLISLAYTGLGSNDPEPSNVVKVEESTPEAEAEARAHSVERDQDRKTAKGHERLQAEHAPTGLASILSGLPVSRVNSGQ